MAEKEFVCTPVEKIAEPPAGNKGGAGTYNGVPGMTPRTPSKNAVPEKTFDKINGDNYRD